MRPLALAFLAACATDDPPAPERVEPECTDVDDDGVCPPEDCDDENPAAYPGQPEIWYSDADEACDGGDDFDADLDGFAVGRVEVYPPTEDGLITWAYPDCDDENPAVNPDAQAICGNGVDDDCDTRDDCSRRGYDTTSALSTGRLTGGSPWAAGDLDGDGLSEWIVQESPGYYLVPPFFEGEAHLVDRAIGQVPYGEDYAFGRLGGADGLDLVLNNLAALFVYLDPELDQSVDATITVGPSAGIALSAGDVTADGSEDLVVGELVLQKTSVFAGPIAGDLGAEDTVATLLSVFDGESTSIGDRVDARSDLDADGVADLAARVEGPGFYNVVAVFPAPILGTLYAQDVPNLGHPDDGFQGSGILDATWDWNQDGHADLVLDHDGHSYLFWGPFDADRNADPDADIQPFYAPDQQGIPEPCGDFNGDGWPDLCKANGKSGVIYGPFEGVYPGWAGNDLTIASPDGEVVAALPIGDVDADGADDLLLTVDRGGDLDPWNEVVPGAVLFGW